MPAIQTTPHYQPLIDPNHPDFKRRYMVWYGGRGGAKSWQIAAGLIIRAVNDPLKILCCREFQNSISDSVLALLEATIKRLEVGHLFKVQNNGIYGINGSEFNFKGLHHNIDSVKSFEGVDILWVEEGQSVSEKSWRVLLPSIRKQGSQVFVSFNPDMETDPTYQRFIANPPKDSYICKVNWSDNPWFTPELEAERLHQLDVDPEAYENIWEGNTWSRSEAQILSGKWIIDYFEPKDEWYEYYGADWGFSQDPTALIELYVYDNILYVHREAVKVKLELDDTLEYWEKHIPGVSRKIVKGDNSRPETISYLKKHGIPRLKAAKKWNGSIMDGIIHLRKYKQIVIHPRCKHSISEAKLYRYKVDPKTDEITKKIIDANNHCIDAWRYSLDKLIKRAGIDYKKFNKI